MNRSLCLAIALASLIALTPLRGSGQDFGAASEKEKTRLGKDEITKLMIQVEGMPVPDRDSRMNRIRQHPSGSQTPRSDFLFCVGLAYLGNAKAQAYLGGAFENGKGIVQDSYESYVWYSIALDNAVEDTVAKQQIRKDRDRIKMTLVSVYPAPSDQELEELVKAQKDRMAEYRAEIGNSD